MEELIKDKTVEERYQERQKQSRPAVDALFEWLHSMEDSVDRSSLIGDAILYTLYTGFRSSSLPDIQLFLSAAPL